MHEYIFLVLQCTECDTKKWYEKCVNLIGLSSIMRHYYDISISYKLGHWWLWKDKTMYILSMATDISDFFNNIQNTHTFHLKIFFLSNFITFWSVHKVLECLILKFDARTEHMTSYWYVQKTRPNDLRNLFYIMRVLTIREIGLTTHENWILLDIN